MGAAGERTAACQCGGLSITVRGEPAVVSMCHCLACQRRTGAPFGVTAFFERSAIVARMGADKSFPRASDSGRLVTTHFCPACGSNVYWDVEMFPDRIGIAAGAFADPSFPAPGRAVWTRTRHHWVAVPPGIPVHDGPAVAHPSGERRGGSASVSGTSD